MDEVPDRAAKAPVDARAVRESLEDILASPAFRGSETCRQFLRAAVERALAGGTEAAAAPGGVKPEAEEVRRRLDEYYRDDCGHHSSVIELPEGSSVPRFRRAWRRPIVITPRRRRMARLAGAMTGLAAIACASWVLTPARTPLDRFWQPVVTAPGDPVMCLATSRHYFLSRNLVEDYTRIPHGAKDPLLTIQPKDIAGLSNYHITIGNFTAIHGISQLLARKGKPVEIRWAAELKPEDVHGRALIMIGAFSNAWTMRKSAAWRYQFHEGTADAPGSAIIDAQHPGVRWTLPPGASRETQTIDYALITRINHPEVGQIEVAAAGMSSFGTQAAGAFLADQEHWRELAAKLPKGWEKKNLQIVLETPVQRAPLEPLPDQPKIWDGKNIQIVPLMPPSQARPQRPKVLAIHVW